MGLRVEDDACEVWADAAVRSVRFARQFPTPRTERVSPGHLVAVATGPDGREAIVWRWVDAVGVTQAGPGSVLLWEPGHGEVLATQRNSAQMFEPGRRVYASAGLPGADWWVAAAVASRPEDADVELAAVEAIFTDDDLWPDVLDPRG